MNTVPAPLTMMSDMSAGDSGGEETKGGAAGRETGGGALEVGSSTAAPGLLVRESVSGPLRLPNTTALHAAGYFARSFSIRGNRKEPRGFFVSPRPVSR